MKGRRVAVVASTALLAILGVGSYATAHADPASVPEAQPATIGLVCRVSDASVGGETAIPVQGVRVEAAPTAGDITAVNCEEGEWDILGTAGEVTFVPATQLQAASDQSMQLATPAAPPEASAP